MQIRPVIILQDPTRRVQHTAGLLYKPASQVQHGKWYRDSGYLR